MAAARESLVEKRLRWLERKRAEAAPGAASDGPPLGRGPLNRHGMPRVPIGQREVPNWPVLDLGVHPDLPISSWKLEVGGLCSRPLTLDWKDFQALPQVEEASDFHCVTTWSAMDQNFGGVRFRDLAELVEPLPEAEYLLCTGADADPGSGEPYTVNLPLLDALQPDVLLAHRWNGGPLPREHGGPVRMITPRLYAWKGAKWIVRIEFLAEDRPGFWEKRGYSNTGRPWRNDRFRS